LAGHEVGRSKWGKIKDMKKARLREKHATVQPLGKVEKGGGGHRTEGKDRLDGVDEIETGEVK